MIAEVTIKLNFSVFLCDSMYKNQAFYLFSMLLFSCLNVNIGYFQHDEDSDSDSVQNPIKIEKAESPQPGHSQQKTENVEDEANVESKVSVEEPNASMEDNERSITIY